MVARAEVDRRTALVRGAILVGGVIVGVACGSSSDDAGDESTPDRSQNAAGEGIAFKLDPCGADGCITCVACSQHAANKYFPTSTGIVRAHPGCDCAVINEDIGTDLYDKLFRSSDNPNGGPVDRRWPWVGSIL